jgi:hypothetical protein
MQVTYKEWEFCRSHTVDGGSQVRVYYNILWCVVANAAVVKLAGVEWSTIALVYIHWGMDVAPIAAGAETQKSISVVAAPPPTRSSLLYTTYYIPTDVAAANSPPCSLGAPREERADVPCVWALQATPPTSFVPTFPFSPYKTLFCSFLSLHLNCIEYSCYCC